MNFPIEIGRVVVSARGRDKGRQFIVTGLLDEDFAYISDGDTHKIDKPKKKRRKHLKPTERFIQEIRSTIASGETPRDYEIRKFLLMEEGKACQNPM